MMVNGKIVSKMVMGLKNGLMVQCMKVIFKMVKRMGMVNYNFLIIVIIMENLVITKYMAMVFIIGKEKGYTKDNGRIIN